MSATNKELRDGKVVYVYPHKHKLPYPKPEITEEMISFSHKVGLVQAADRFNVPRYYLLKARNELHSRSPS